MSIVGTLPTTIKNGDAEDANVVMSLFNYIQAQVNANAAPLVSPALTGNPTAPTPAAHDNSVNLATTAYVDGSFTSSWMLSARNKIRNGRMDIAQRGTSFAAVSNAQYTLDGWVLNTSGSQVSTVSQQANPNTSSEFQNVLRLVVTTANAAPAAGDFLAVYQNIEGYLVRDLIGNPIAIQFTVKSPKAGTHCVAIIGGGYSYILTYNVTAANTQQKVTLALPTGLITTGSWNWTNGTGFSLRFTLMAGTSFQTTAGSWQAGTFLGTSAQVNCAGAVNNTFEITGVQLERNSVSTQFEHTDFALELVRNQRYYEIVYAHTFFYQTAGNIICAVGPHKVTKRATPTVGAVTTFATETNFTYTSTVSDANNVVSYGTATASGSVEIQRQVPVSAEL